MKKTPPLPENRTDSANTYIPPLHWKSFFAPRKTTYNFLSSQTGKQNQLIFIHTTFSMENFFKYKDKQALVHRNNVVYRLICSSNNTYIGQTRRNLITRLQEDDPGNKRCSNTDVTKYLLENYSHIMDFETPKMLATGLNTKDLLIKEKPYSFKKIALPSTLMKLQFRYMCFAISLHFKRICKISKFIMLFVDFC